jgi:hypothetical protein
MTMNHKVRAAAVAMGKRPEVLRECLEETDLKSLLKIYEKEFEFYRRRARKRGPRNEVIDLPDFLKNRGSYENF